MLITKLIVHLKMMNPAVAGEKPNAGAVKLLKFAVEKEVLIGAAMLNQYVEKAKVGVLMGLNAKTIRLSVVLRKTKLVAVQIQRTVLAAISQKNAALLQLKCGVAIVEVFVEKQKISAQVTQNAVITRLNVMLIKMSNAVVLASTIANAVRLKKLAANLDQTNGAVRIIQFVAKHKENVKRDLNALIIKLNATRIKRKHAAVQVIIACAASRMRHAAIKVQTAGVAKLGQHVEKQMEFA